jgi:hypothetical protein
LFWIHYTLDLKTPFTSITFSRRKLALPQKVPFGNGVNFITIALIVVTPPSPFRFNFVFAAGTVVSEDVPDTRLLAGIPVKILPSI